jgi:hypothetical protein
MGGRVTVFMRALFFIYYPTSPKLIVHLPTFGNHCLFLLEGGIFEQSDKNKKSELSEMARTLIE